MFKPPDLTDSNVTMSNHSDDLDSKNTKENHRKPVQTLRICTMHTWIMTVPRFNFLYIRMHQVTFLSVMIRYPIQPYSSQSLRHLFLRYNFLHIHFFKLRLTSNITISIWLCVLLQSATSLCLVQWMFKPSHHALSFYFIKLDYSEMVCSEQQMTAIL